MILRRYITWQVATTTVLVLGFLVVMLLGGRLIRYFGMAAEGGLDVGVLFSLIGYNLPFFLELIFPLSFFIALMLTFGRLYADHEMAAINGSGISRGRLARLLTPLVLLVFVVQAWIALVAKPWGVERATNIWKEQAVLEVFDLIQPRKFISSGDYHLYVGDIGENREYLKDVIVIQSTKTTQTPSTPNQPNQDQKDVLIFAKSATQVDNDDGIVQLDLHQGRRYQVDTDSQKYNQIGFERYRINLTTADKGEGEPMKIEGWTTPSLMGVNANHHMAQAAHAELGYRMSLPWLMVIAVMLAPPLAQVRPRQGRWLKLIPAMFLFVANVLIVISLKETITKGKLSVWAYPVAVAVLLLLALYINYHGRVVARMRLSKSTKVEMT